MPKYVKGSWLISMGIGLAQDSPGSRLDVVVGAGVVVGRGVVGGAVVAAAVVVPVVVIGGGGLVGNGTYIASQSRASLPG